ncbi:MAG: cytochrome C oxidase subunit IV family protein [Rhodocyclaceae bacterium]|nr:cytochrome C oxidase subunit IV family protein [Rhodocyclaceae bacterium]MDZ4215307.1 cytochrome C oxidase subunit IV family protein [Rhodocyclaceae bacterium]
MSAHFLNVIWVALMVATILTWFIGKSVTMDVSLVVAVLLISAVKGWLIIYDFMALRRVKVLWRALVLGWLLLTLAVILLAYWLGLK